MSENSIQRRARLRLERGLIDRAEYERQCNIALLKEEPITYEQRCYMQRQSGACY